MKVQAITLGFHPRREAVLDVLAAQAFVSRDTSTMKQNVMIQLELAPAPLIQSCSVRFSRPPRGFGCTMHLRFN